MSNYLALAMVTATLRNMLQNAVNRDLDGADVTAVRPIAEAEGLPGFGANIFLYQVVPNSVWRNADLPTRSGGGHLMQRPVIALDLHYLITFYGDDGTLQPQRVMGSVVRALHTRPILTGAMIQATRDAAELEDPDHYLLASDFDAEVERVKLTPLPFNLEELSKLWSVLLQTPYALSMEYLASVVLLEADETPMRPLPVRERFIGVAPFRRAVVQRVDAEDGAQAPIVFGSTAIVRGAELEGPVQRIRVGPADTINPIPGSVTPSEIRIDLSDASLRAGIWGLQIVYADGSTSSIAPIILRPSISRDGGGNFDVDISDLETDPEDGTHSARITVTLEPAVDPEQRVELYLNEYRPSPGPGASYQFSALERDAITDEVAFDVQGVASGTYLLRVQVNGAETVLEVEEDEANPDFGYYTQPAVTLP